MASKSSFKRLSLQTCIQQFSNAVLEYVISDSGISQVVSQEEIDQAFEDADDLFPDYNTIQNMPYLDMVINETLRYTTLDYNLIALL